MQGHSSDTCLVSAANAVSRVLRACLVLCAVSLKSPVVRKPSGRAASISSALFLTAPECLFPGVC